MTTPRILGGVQPKRGYAFDGSIAVNFGDLMFLDSDDVKPASSLTDQTSETLNQAAFARTFVGLAADGRIATDTNSDDDFPILEECEAEFDCASSTFTIGDLLGVDEASSGTALEDQKLVKVTDPHLAIATAIEAHSSATTRVKVRFWPRRQQPHTVFPTNIQDQDTGDAVVLTNLSPRYQRITPSANLDVRMPAFTACPPGEVWVIENDSDTTSDFALTVEDSASVSTGFTVAEGAKRLLWHNGTAWLSATA